MSDPLCTVARLYRFAVREGDTRLAEALRRVLVREAPLAARTAASLEDALGLRERPD